MCRARTYNIINLNNTYIKYSEYRIGHKLIKHRKYIISIYLFDSLVGYTQHYHCGAITPRFFVNNSLNEIEKRIFEKEKIARNQLRNRSLEPCRSIFQIFLQRNREGYIYVIHDLLLRLNHRPDNLQTLVGETLMAADKTTRYTRLYTGRPLELYLRHSRRKLYEMAHARVNEIVSWFLEEEKILCSVSV